MRATLSDSGMVSPWLADLVALHVAGQVEGAGTDVGGELREFHHGPSSLDVREHAGIDDTPRAVVVGALPLDVDAHALRRLAGDGLARLVDVDAGDVSHGAECRRDRAWIDKGEHRRRDRVRARGAGLLDARRRVAVALRADIRGGAVIDDRCRAVAVRRLEQRL